MLKHIVVGCLLLTSSLALAEGTAGTAQTAEGAKTQEAGSTAPANADPKAGDPAQDGSSSPKAAKLKAKPRTKANAGSFQCNFKPGEAAAAQGK